jgi:hypothetical protein
MASPCFEAFVAPRNAERYAELVTALSAGPYAFDHYRSDMQPLPVIKPPSIQLKVEHDLLAIDVTVQMRSLAADSAVGFSAVIESLDGGVSHWALTHPGPKADFHDATGWTAAFQRQTAEVRPCN